jgi:cytochrome c-type biogenesis protein
VDLTLGAALLAGLISFLSPCVLPVVPAYLGQLGVIAVTSVSPAVVAAGRQGLAAPGTDAVTGLDTNLVAGAAAAAANPALAEGAAAIAAGSRGAAWGTPGGWRTLPSALAFVAGFTLLFTLFGLALSGALQPLRDNQTILRQAGGVLLIVFGLNLMGILHLGSLARTWRPLTRLSTRSRSGPGTASGILGGLFLGAAFAVGWTPCIGPTLGAVLTLAIGGPSVQVAALLVAYSLGLGVPFLLLAVAVDRAPAITRPLLRWGRQIELLGGGLVVMIGVAILLDWLAAFALAFSNLWPQV